MRDNAFLEYLRMSNRKEGRTKFATDHSYGLKTYRRFQDMILEKAQVDCSIRISDGILSIRAKDYAEYLLAKSVISEHTTLRIIRDNQ